MSHTRIPYFYSWIYFSHLLKIWKSDTKVILLLFHASKAKQLREISRKYSRVSNKRKTDSINCSPPRLLIYVLQWHFHVQVSIKHGIMEYQMLHPTASSGCSPRSFVWDVLYSTIINPVALQQNIRCRVGCFTAKCYCIICSLVWYSIAACWAQLLLRKLVVSATRWDMSIFKDGHGPDGRTECGAAKELMIYWFLLITYTWLIKHECMKLVSNLWQLQVAR